jgi:hypothetical protein
MMLLDTPSLAQRGSKMVATEHNIASLAQESTLTLTSAEAEHVFSLEASDSAPYIPCDPLAAPMHRDVGGITVRFRDTVNGHLTRTVARVTPEGSHSADSAL